MPDFFYQIKGKGAEGNRQWPPLFSGRVEGVNSKEARKKVEEEYGMKLPGGKLRKEAETQQLLLTLIDMNSRPWLLERFETKTCSICEKQYTLNEKYCLNEGGYREHCSVQCTDVFRRQNAIAHNVNFDFNGIHPAVIYKITCKTTGLCYIGKTTQAFTLRWYQHFYQGSGTKFYNAIEQYGITDWTFEVIEIVDLPKNTYGKDKHDLIIKREMFWINHYDSIRNGYNSVNSKNELVEEIDPSQPTLFVPEITEAE